MAKGCRLFFLFGLNGEQLSGTESNNHQAAAALPPIKNVAVGRLPVGWSASPTHLVCTVSKVIEFLRNEYVDKFKLRGFPVSGTRFAPLRLGLTCLTTGPAED
jgi:hypothetical protein